MVTLEESLEMIRALGVLSGQADNAANMANTIAADFAALKGAVSYNNSHESAFQNVDVA